jgi:MOSC domain-containing protein
MTTRPQPGGIERDVDVLRTINRERAGFLGAGALVTGAGAFGVGDELRVG